ncbi:hypothetical protein M0R72_18030 [Candidatus Pacearchaeota archaeon]|jgi:hypothetical protein|nr:hypothetical protein [Candidatus Pacearchaeota archaeon]
MNESPYPKASKPYPSPRKKATKPAPKPEPQPKPVPVYVATRTCGYTFVCDGAKTRLEEGVSPQVTEAQLRELIRYKHVREVK